VLGHFLLENRDSLVSSPFYSASSLRASWLTLIFPLPGLDVEGASSDILMYVFRHVLLAPSPLFFIVSRQHERIFDFDFQPYYGGLWVFSLLFLLCYRLADVFFPFC